MKKLTQKDNDALDAAEFTIEMRLSLLQAKADGLVPDPLDDVFTSKDRERLKKEKEEMDIRIDELKQLLKEMKGN